MRFNLFRLSGDGHIDIRITRITRDKSFGGLGVEIVEVVLTMPSSLRSHGRERVKGEDLSFTTPLPHLREGSTLSPPCIDP